MKNSWYEKREGQAEHLVYLNKEGKELEKLLNGEKSMLIRGAAGKKSPLGGRAKKGDRLYFVETASQQQVTHRGVLEKVVESEKMTPAESVAFVEKYQGQLNLSKKQYLRWAGKKYLAVYEVSHLEAISPFSYRREKNMDDWIITEKISEIKA